MNASKWAALLVLLILALGVPTLSAQQQEHDRAVGVADAVDTLHVVYLHGKIVQQQGRNAVSPEYGPYEFDEIVEALGEGGARVHAPIRTGESDTTVAAEEVAALVRGLLGAGVPAEDITIVGASLGSVIAMRASAAMENPSLRFVLLGACNDWVKEELDPDLHGHVLSIYEESDVYGQSCESVVAGKPAISSFDEVRLATGLGHGFLYRPLPEWVGPALRWSAAHGQQPETPESQQP